MKTKISRDKSRNAQALVLLLPFLILFIIFTILPVITSIIFSFFSFDMINPLKFVGFDNYMRMFAGDDIFPITLRNTIVFAVITGPAGFLLSFVLAWFINEFKPLARTILSFMFYAPSLVGNGLFIWQVLFSSDSYGYANSLLLTLGIITEPILWFKDANYVFTIVVIIQLWQSMGISFLSNIAGLQNVNEELYEVGSIDGIRNRWQELWYITLPTMKNMLVQYMSDVGTTRYEMGYASAIAVVLFLLMVIARNVFVAALNKTGK